MNRTTEWAINAVRTLEGDPTVAAVSAHLDQLLGPAYLTASAVSQAHDCFLAILTQVAERASWLQVRLAIPLPNVDELNTEIPDLSRLQQLLDLDEPPNFYLVRRDIGERPSDQEEYSCPLEQEWITPPFGAVVSRYSCGRGAIARERRWAFTRTVWFEHFTNELMEPRAVN